MGATESNDFRLGAGGRDVVLLLDRVRWLDAARAPDGLDPLRPVRTVYRLARDE